MSPTNSNSNSTRSLNRQRHAIVCISGAEKGPSLPLSLLLSLFSLSFSSLSLFLPRSSVLTGEGHVGDREQGELYESHVRGSEQLRG